jgi:hypothetical protein
VPRADREGRGAIADHRHAAGILQDGSSASDVGTESGLADGIYLFVAMAVACQLMTLRDDAADQRRVPFGHPAQGEEGGAHIGGGEEVKHAMGVCLHASLARVPAFARDDAGESLHLEPVLHVDGHGIAKRAHARPPRMAN